ncbi:hypothetical protein A9Q75_08480 [Colwellia psychrerythraea]|uniref:F5/8 type C domain-containing protein n=1 Tax=Colwellia psychrerythraea TaxID=28229 RepID=A0A1Y5EE81_COLPS|nr:hypothetical protein A9Q75_08480 [Colwellia psychrerythraea]
MKIQSLIQSVILAVSLLSSTGVFAESGVYAGGPTYNSSYAINELKTSGFTNVVVWTIHIESDGSLGFNGEFPLVAGGSYIGGSHYPNFKGDIASLKEGSSLINRVEFGLSGYGSGTYNNVRDLLACSESHCGTGPNSILYRNFSALKAVFPTIDAVNNDDEDTYHVSSSVQFHIMLADLGFKTAIVPYMNKSFWQSLVTQVNQARPGAIDALYLQAYAGGSSNDPCNWDLGLPVYAGLWSKDYSPVGIQNKMQGWKDSCPNVVEGGFMWLYDDFDNSSQVAAYSSAINNVFDASTPTPNDPVITARASIHGSENQDKAFDGVISTKWLDNAGTPSSSVPSWIQIKYTNAKLVNLLTLVSANDADSRDPQNIDMLATNDGNTWSTLGTWSNVEFPGRNVSKQLSFENTQLFSEYKLIITKNKGDDSLTQIAEILLADNSNPQPNIVDHTGYQGVTFVARASINSNEDESKTFDDNNNSKWLDNGGVPTSASPSWVQATLPVAKTVNDIAITSANDAIERDPQNFVLKGSNDNGTNWTEVGSWTNVVWSSRYERQVFSVSSLDAYSTYRLSINANQGGSSMTQIAEIELLGPEL